MRKTEINQTNAMASAIARYHQNADAFLSIELISLFMARQQDELSRDDLQNLLSLQTMLLKFAATPPTVHLKKAG